MFRHRLPLVATWPAETTWLVTFFEKLRLRNMWSYSLEALQAWWPSAARQLSDSMLQRNHRLVRQLLPNNPPKDGALLRLCHWVTILLQTQNTWPTHLRAFRRCSLGHSGTKFLMCQSEERDNIHRLLSQESQQHSPPTSPTCAL